MAQQLEFLFDFGSPTAYLAYARLPGLVERTGVEIVWTPMLLGGVFKETGNVPPMAVPAKGKYLGLDMARFIRRYDISYERNPHFPVNTLALMRGAVAHQMKPDGNFDHYVKTCFENMWVKPRNLNEPSEISAMLAEAGFDGEQLMGWIGEQEVKDRLMENTGQAVARGVFGAPSFFIGDELFFGQDRIDWMEWMLS